MTDEEFESACRHMLYGAAGMFALLWLAGVFA